MAGDIALCPTCHQPWDRPPPVVSVVVPIKLVSEANEHAFWRTRQKRAKTQGTATQLLLRAAMGVANVQPSALLPAVVTITRIAPRFLDSDNLTGSAKHVRDAVATLLRVNDRDMVVTWEVVEERGRTGEYAARIEIRRRV